MLCGCWGYQWLADSSARWQGPAWVSHPRKPSHRPCFHPHSSPACLPSTAKQMYRFGGKLIPGTDIQDQLRRFVLEEYAGTTPEDVPPPPSAFDWLAKGLQHKATAVKAALEAQVLGLGASREEAVVRATYQLIS